MKKVLISFILIIISSIIIKAQDLCNNLFPTKEGSVLINQSYNNYKELINTIRYEIMAHYNNPGMSVTEMKFTITDASDIIIEQGVIRARCENGNFSMDLVNSTRNNQFMNMLTSNPEFIGNFLYFPIMMDQTNINNTTPTMDVLEFTIPTNENNTDIFAKVKLFNAEYLNLEEIVVPAAIYNAYKIKFDFEVVTGTQTRNYKITEWYAAGAGIVRLEVYDDLYNLISYTELTSIRE